jgi:uncharacterized protein involved in exopolysaccharide biosynthesis
MADDEDDDGSGVSPLDQIRSYAAYAARALRRRVWGALLTIVICGLCTALVVSIWPRTYTCVVVLAAQDNSVLAGDKSTDALHGAAEVILNRENVSAIVDKLGLVKSWEQSLPPLNRLKIALVSLVWGPLDEAAKRSAVIGLVEARLFVIPPGWGQARLEVGADWHDSVVAANLAGAAAQSFLDARQVAEISTITEYIDILDGHATALRKEIQELADQSSRSRDERLAKSLDAAAAAAPASAAPAPVRVSVPAPPPRLEDFSQPKAELAAKEAALKSMEAERARRISDAEARITELRTQFTSAHPLVVAAETNLASVSQESTQLLQLRAEVARMSALLKSKMEAQQLAEQGGPRVASVPHSAGTPGASTVEPLPAEIMRLMQEDSGELDPAISAQFRTAVAKYATLRDKIGTARVDLDTAQAAFKHRYQVVTPATPPKKPSKPKVLLLLAIGFGASLVGGALVAVLLELKTGRIVERWQVYNIGLPLLGEMGWPPRDDP